ncbi:MAG: type I methionyl aminopeptidase [Gemmatimonadota bacterium]|nr:type I methionyl aminopeptidase [Gemmatimonadota bacterium]
MSINDPAELEGLRRAGVVTRKVLDAMKAAVRPGISTRELDHVALEVMRLHGARSAPQLVYDFPGTTCISVNEEIVHGIPGARVLASGDLVKLDVTVELDGYMADACETVAVGRAGRAQRDLIDCATRAFFAGYAQVRPGARAYDIGAAVQAEVVRSGFSVVRELTGHGIGRTIHEEPMIPNYREPRHSRVLTEGLVFTIEPLIAQGSGRMMTMRDGWTIRTRDRSLSAHFEHTVFVTSSGAQLLTA